jgi:hypothetical protein
MLFLFAVEDRKILHPRTAKTEQVELYAEGYSLSRLRERSIKHCHDRYDDIWDSLKVTFRGLATGQEALGLPPLGSLFAEEQCVELVRSNISNRRLLNAVRAIAWFRENDALVPVNYKSMGTEELGSVYESLLELTPAIDESGKGFGFIKADEEEGKGNSRKTSGSYYTPDSLVQQLLDTTLDPVVADRLKGKSTKEEKEKAILSITVIDPACGSGHFLLGAARRLAEKLASIRAEGGEATDYRRALRDVIASCIHGVDRNPMAIQLAKVALWLEGYVADKPLSFLDHHLVVGDSILSIIDLDMATKGIPDEAYEVITGDDKAVARALKARNKTSRDSELKVKQGTMDLFGGTKVDMGKSFAKIDVLSDDTLEGVAKKVGQLEIFMKEAQADWRVTAAKLYLGAYLLPKTQGFQVPTSSEILAAMNGESLREVMLAVDAACHTARALIWPLAFPHVFEKGGFDVVLGNPPWERITLKEKEFFATRAPSVTSTKNKSERFAAIQRLINSEVGSAERKCYDDFLEAKRISEVSSAFAHDAERFPLTGHGDVNLYALFSENIKMLINPLGRAGFIAPTGIATDKSTSEFFSALMRDQMVASLYDFENKRGIFKSVDRTVKFCLLTIGREAMPEFAFMLHDVREIADNRKNFRADYTLFKKLNPKTGNLAVIRSRADVDTLKSIYDRVGIFEPSDRDDEIANAWENHYLRMWHLTNDTDYLSESPSAESLPVYEAKYFGIYDHRWAEHAATGLVSSDEADDGEEGASLLRLSDKLDAGRRVRTRYHADAERTRIKYLGLPASILSYEDEKLAQLLAGVYQSVLLANGLSGSKDFISPRWLSDRPHLVGSLEPYPLHGNLVLKHDDLVSIREAPMLSDACRKLLRLLSPRWVIGYRIITKAQNRRTLIPCVLPGVAMSFSVVNTIVNVPARKAACLVAQWSSLVCDYVVRSKLGATTLSYGYFDQIPTLPPESFSASHEKFICSRVLQLVFVSNDLRCFYEDITADMPGVDERPDGRKGMPYEYDPDRRHLLQCELDAYIGYLWGLCRADLEFILDPKSRLGSDYPSETFRGLKNQEIKQYGEYRTQRLVLEAWDRIVEPLRRGQA